MHRLLGFILLTVSALALGNSSRPMRIASGTVGSDEILWELLKGEHERIVALSMFAEDSRYSLLGPVPHWLKGRVGNSLEALIALKPDLAVLASYNRRELAPQLEAAGIKVLVQENFHDIEAIYANIRAIAKATQNQSSAEALLTSLQGKIERWRTQRPPCPQGRGPSVMFFSSDDRFPGKDTTFTSALEAAGFRNLIAERGLRSWVPLSREVLVGMQPDFVVLSGSQQDLPALQRRLSLDPIWNKMRAVRDQRFILVSEALLSSVSHKIVDLVEIFHQAYRCPSEVRSLKLD